MISSRFKGMPPGGKAGSFLPPAPPDSPFPYRPPLRNGRKVPDGEHRGEHRGGPHRSRCGQMARRRQSRIPSRRPGMSYSDRAMPRHLLGVGGCAVSHCAIGASHHPVSFHPDGLIGDDCAHPCTDTGNDGRTAAGRQRRAWGDRRRPAPRPRAMRVFQHRIPDCPIIPAARARRLRRLYVLSNTCTIGGAHLLPRWPPPSSAPARLRQR